MSRKKTQVDEFQAMAQVAEILKPFAEDVRHRIIFAVSQKLTAEAPKKRVRSKLGNNSLQPKQPSISLDVQGFDAKGNAIQ